MPAKTDDNFRIFLLKNKIKSFNEIAKTAVMNKSLSQIDSCYFNAEKLDAKSKVAKIKMDYKNINGDNKTIHISININKLATMDSKKLVGSLVALAGKLELNAASANNNRERLQLMLYDKVSAVFKKNKKAAEFLNPSEITKNMLFFLPDEKINQILEGKISDTDLERLINNEIDSVLFSSSEAKINAHKEEEKKKAKEEERQKPENKDKTEEQLEAEEENKNQAFVESLQVPGGEDKRRRAAELLNGNRNDRSREINKELLQNGDLTQSFKDLKSGITQSKLQTFCDNFSKSFMAAQGLPPVEIKIVPNSPDGRTMGEFIDYGNKHQIEIYQDAIKGDLVEFTATLSHELTHAVDASLNKINGRSGIQNSISTDVSKSGLTGEAKAFLDKLNFQCYQADPCEQTARNGEQIGIDFIKGIPGMGLEADIKKYEAGDAKTQGKVDNVRENFASIIQDAKAKLAKLDSQGKLTPEGRKLIEERIAYLESRQMQKAKEDAIYKTSRMRGTMDLAQATERAM